MIFHEIYGCYYNAVAKLIGMAIEGELTERGIYEIASQHAFEESAISIARAIREQEWQLIDGELETPIVFVPEMPLTTLEKRWLKTILADPRAKLFDIPTDGLEDVEPLFLPEDIVHFDRYTDGDDYESEQYLAHFGLIRRGIKEHKKLKITFLSGKGIEKRGTYAPVGIEYSDKEDKFRLLCVSGRNTWVINIGRILSCEKTEESFPEDIRIAEGKKKTLCFEVTDDERRTLERTMMKFAHFKKEVERISENVYRVQIEYDRDDETDVLIQIMSFGSCVKVLAPEELKEELKRRIARQLSMLAW